MQILKQIKNLDEVPAPSIARLIEKACLTYGSKPAFCFRKNPKDDLTCKSYFDFWCDFKALGSAVASLIQEPIKKEKKGSHEMYPRFALVGENCYEWAVTYLSIISGLGVAVPFDRQLPANEIKNLLKRSEAEVFIFTPSCLNCAKEARHECDKIKYFICLDTAKNKNIELPQDERFLLLSDLLKKGYEIQEKELAEAKNAEEQKSKIYPRFTPHEEDIALLLFTSGTTSKSKGVLLTHSNICNNIAQIKSVLPLRENERMLSVLPLHHTFENTAGFIYPLTCGATIYFLDGLRYLANNLKDWQISAMIGVPLLFENIYKRISDSIKSSTVANASVSVLKPLGRGLQTIGLDLNRILFRSVLKALGGQIRLIVSGASAIKPEVIEGFKDFGIDFRQGYGMTETSPVISLTTEENSARGGVGYPLPGVEVAIDTDEIYRGAIGEILTRSKAVMKGYYMQDEATAEVMTEDGWLRTGDLGYQDQNGSLHITGRSKNMIVLNNGKKVFPEEVEEILLESELLNEVFVWGTSDKNEIVLCLLAKLEKEKVKSLALDYQKDKNIKEDKIEEEGQKLFEKWENNLEVEENFVKYLQQRLTASLNPLLASMPIYKRIRYSFITREDFIKTTTLKLKRKEQEQRFVAFRRSFNLPLNQLQYKEIR